MAKEKLPTREHPSEPPKSTPLATPAGFYDLLQPGAMAYVPREIAAGATGQVILYEPHQGESTATMVSNSTIQLDEISIDAFDARLQPQELERRLNDPKLPAGQREFLEKYSLAQSQPKYKDLSDRQSGSGAPDAGDGKWDHT